MQCGARALGAGGWEPEEGPRGSGYLGLGIGPCAFDGGLQGLMGSAAQARMGVRA